jgi:hypothetical protein
MLTSWRWIIFMETDGTHVITPAKPYMDLAMTRQPGNTRRISRLVCVISLSTLRSGVPGNDHAPF